MSLGYDGDDVARDEGEGFADAHEWRHAHIAYWDDLIGVIRAEIGDPRWKLSHDEPVVVQWFRLVNGATRLSD